MAHAATAFQMPVKSMPTPNVSSDMDQSFAHDFCS